uniref:ABC1 atypical kinase-like domain-containing protein n=1 Tax=Odontella aurita TaxID=265563 RepID=A0A7S4N5F6_9STRA|mmetsp:Transcript_478/g.1437  ORF Transcript_478/g.1437 Transcript_478/m.1437 type:complete len:807 (+) Transcript_478:31-2451(+)
MPKRNHWRDPPMILQRPERRRRPLAVASAILILCLQGNISHSEAFFAPVALVNRVVTISSSHRIDSRIFAATTDRVSRGWRERAGSLKGPSPYTAQTSGMVIKPTKRSVDLMPVTGYNADEICEHYDRRPLEVGWRLNSLSLPLLGWYIGLLFDKLLGTDQKEETQRMRGEELRMHLVRSGSVALVKSGQALSLRPDLLKNKIWAEELGKLVDAVGSFSDTSAMEIMRKELSDLLPRIKAADLPARRKRDSNRRVSRVQAKVESDPVLSLFEFDNDSRPVASASIGQVYRARIRRGPQLEAAIGKEEAAIWGGKTVAVKVQRPNALASASLDMYLIRRAAMWLSMFRGGDLPAIADQFGMQLFGELDYVREADNCERFRDLYGSWDNVVVPRSCCSLTRKKVLVQEWVEGEKGPWVDTTGIDMVRIGLKCSVDQLLNTGLFHADPHRGNLLRSPDGKLAVIDFGMMADVSEEERYGLIGLVIGLQNKDLPLVTENLLKLGFLDDTTQLDQIIPRLRAAVKNSTGGTGKASDVSFSKLQAELDAISRENVLRFKTPAFFTVIIRSLTILEGFALAVDPNFRLVRGSYPYVLRQLLSPKETNPESLRKLLIRLLTVNGEGEEIEWETLRDFLRLAKQAASTYDPSMENADKMSRSRQTIALFFQFLTSKTGIFLKKPLINEISEAIDGMASIGEANLLRISRGIIRPLPGGNGPINNRRMEEMQALLDVVQSALVVEGHTGAQASRERLEAIVEILRELTDFFSSEGSREEFEPILAEVSSVFQQVAVRVIEIRGTRAMRSALRLASA